MTRVGVTGHQRLTDPSGWPWVKDQLAQAIQAIDPPLVGLSSLAAGADQVFAESVLEHGGTLEVVLPFAGYRDVLHRDEDRESYDRLLSRAQRVRLAPPAASRNEAYLLAGRMIVDDSDIVLAVSEGRVSGGVGGTADIVDYATVKGVPLIVIDPLERSVKRP